MSELTEPPMTGTDLATLKVGGTVESKGLFNALYPEEGVQWRLLEKINTRQEYKFTLTYLGIALGTSKVTVSKDGRINAELV